MTATDTPTAWPVIGVHDVTPADVTATLGGGRPTISVGCVHISPARNTQVDLYGDLDRLDALLDAGKHAVDELRQMLRSTDRAAS